MRLERFVLIIVKRNASRTFWACYSKQKYVSEHLGLMYQGEMRLGRFALIVSCETLLGRFWATIVSRNANRVSEHLGFFK